MTGAAADAAGPVSAFCCHRSVDSEVVGAFARRLREDEIDAWFDDWEIQAGDNIVAMIQKGLQRCPVALVFLSSTPGEGGDWADAEQSALVALLLQNPGRRVIPVLVDPDAEIPPFLVALRHRSIDDYDEIRDAILGVSRKPQLGVPTPPVTGTVGGPPPDPPPGGRGRSRPPSPSCSFCSAPCRSWCRWPSTTARRRTGPTPPTPTAMPATTLTAIARPRPPPT